ncbi:class I SAM-dependent methyltransferase [Acidovorax sp. GBBC 3334]|uniref:class I SAM-dependent methyltransferase n=1 Tax=Acidovorax sp. GBBC 3334 TaxID=2940496 RepID=UPI002304BB64|nr:class I SAM-dependent methyltransferase [Acidovorax sp. GBBC 3334]MDA8454905.1 class I SAM-dependent methyltransferase [Acidovorax sp. GBBC 3334]
MRLFLPWPLPAFLAWAAAWLAFLLSSGPAGLPWWGSGLAGCAVGLAASLLGRTRWRQGFIAGGFPLSFLLAGAAQVPAWAWLAPLGVLLLVYPLNAWRDAPLFPTPRGALAGLERAAPLAPGARVLDAGCGLGDGLRALRSAYPAVRLEGLEWSWPLRCLCALRCPWARVRRGDIWRAGWGAYPMVYLFQRPESMARAAAKARAEMAADAWLVSLAFEIPGASPEAVLRPPGGHAVWVYRVGRLPPVAAGGAAL